MRNFKTGLLSVVFGLSAGAAAAQTDSYSCDNGTLVVKSSTAVTLEEWTVVVGLDVKERPDFGHLVFQRPDGRYVWARTSEMQRICREKQACFAMPVAAIGLAAGPLMRRNDDGSVSPCEEQTEVPILACQPDGSLSSGVVPNDPDHLKNFFGLDPLPGPDYVVFRDGTGASIWSNMRPDALATQCPEPAQSGPLNDGVWKAQLRESSNAGCPPQAIAQGEATGIAIGTTERRIVWEDPFRPAQLIPDDSFVRPWTANGPGWDALVVSQDQQMVQINIAFNMAIQSPDQVIVDSVLDMTMNAQVAATAGLSPQCKYLATFDIVRISD